MSTVSPSKNSFTVFFSNPLVGIIGSLASIIGVLLAVYFYLEGKEYPQLTYYVHPVKAIVVRAGQASRLTASFDNKVIETDITATQIALWNQGKRAIKKDNVLKPIVIHTENNTPILEATIRKSSREVVQLAVNTDELQKGRVLISWNILEHNDGGIIQLTYAGNPNLNIQLDGVIEGQNQIEQLTFSEKIKSPDEQYTSLRKERRYVGFFFLGMAAVIALTLFIPKLIGLVRKKGKDQASPSPEGLEEDDLKDKLKDSERKGKESIGIGKAEIERIDRLMNTFSYVLLIITCGVAMYMIFLAKEPGPPFGF